MDEVETDKHMNMVLVEFIEAIGRVAEKLTLPHLIDVSNNHYLYINNRMK